MDRAEVTNSVVEALEQLSDIQALFLTGSMGRGVSDEFSDVDLVAVVSPGAVQEVAEEWLRLRQPLGVLIYDAKLDFGATLLFNQITDEWVRYDLVVTTEEALGPRSQATVKPLFDRAGVYDRLPEHVDLSRPSPRIAERLVPEFFRVLSLVSVVLGREDYAVGASGSGLLRTMLIQGLTELVSVEDRGGALYLRRLLSPGDYDFVVNVPAIAASRESVTEVHRYCAEKFVPVSQELCRLTGVPWPAELVRMVGAKTEPLVGRWLDSWSDERRGDAIR